MKLLLFIFILNFPFLAFGQNTKTGFGTIRGVILTADKQATPYVSVLLKNMKEGATTDENGNFEIKSIKPGSYLLKFSLLGYVDTVMTVTVSANETVFLKLQLQSTYKQLKEVIVAASLHKTYMETNTSESLRLNLSLVEVPQNIIVTTRQLISDQGLLSTTEAFRTVSGVQKTYGGLNDYGLIMRGTDVGTWTLYRNGVGGYWWNQQEDVSMLEKIEFLKGPTDFMSGVSGGGGMINMVTKQPVKEPIAAINAGFGSYSLIRLTTDLGGTLSKNGKISYRFNAGLHSQERAFQFGKAVRYFVCPVLKYDINTKTSVTAEYNYMWGKTSGNNDNVPSINGKMFALPRDFAVADDKSDQLIVADNYYRLWIKHDFNENWHLNAQFAYVNGKWGGHTMSTNPSEPVTNDILYRVAYYDDWRNFSKVAMGFVDGKFHTGKKIEHKVVFGPELVDFGVTDNFGNTWPRKKFGLYLPNPNYYIRPRALELPVTDSQKQSVNSIAFYAQDNIKVAGKLIVTLAGRFTHASLTLSGYHLPDYLEKTWYNVFTPRTGLTWLFTKEISAYALYDQYFQVQIAPNIEQKPFKPLTGYDMETGIKGFFFDKRLGLNFSLFHMVKNNTVTPDPENVGYYIQKGQITSSGLDFDLTGNLTSAFTVNANYEYADAKITKASDPNDVGIKNFGTPDHSANLWLKYQWQRGRLKGFSFAMGWQYMGERSAVWYYNPDPDTRFLPAYNLLDAALTFSNEKFNISLNVYNITNTNYASTGYFYDYINEWRYTPGEPINFRLSFGVNLVRSKRL